VQCWDEDIKYHIERQGISRATRKLKCYWPNVPNLVNALLPQTIIAAPGTLGGIGQWPDPYACPQIQSLLLSTVDIEGIPNQTGLSNYQFANIQGGQTNQIGFTTAQLTFIYESQRFQAFDSGEFSLDYSAEKIRLPGHIPMFSFTANDTVGGSTVIDPADSPPFDLWVMSIEWTLRYQPSIAATAVVTAGNAPVNSVAFTFTFAGQSLTFAAGYLKFMGARTRYGPVAGGSPMWRTTYRFKYRPIQWNSAINPYTWTTGGNVQYGTVYFGGTNTTLYGTSDLSTLLGSVLGPV
jgi:hypothetical protein